MEQLYVLKLEGDRYYVGKSSDVAKRVKEHATGNGAGYTKLYKPTQVLEVRPMKSPQDENNLTREYMTKYGVNNVRGGSYSQIALAPEVKRVLSLEIRGNTDTCFTCGKRGHFTSSCRKRDESEEDSDDDSDDDESEEDSDDDDTEDDASEDDSDDGIEDDDSVEITL
jgi:predicted GIY-YIG superfamily endonuclease